MAPRFYFDGLTRLPRPLRREVSVESADALVWLDADDETQARCNGLSDKNTAETRPPVERVELAVLGRGHSLLAGLKIEARAALAS
jgi:hypothetical protein